MNFSKRPLLTTAAAVLIGAGVVGIPGGFWLADHAQAATLAESGTAQATTSAPQVSMNLPDFSSLVDKYGPAVVNITVTGHEETGMAQGEFPGFGENDPFGQFFRHFQIPIPHQAPMRGEGSGFIVRSDGIILTNAHVVKDAQEVTVKLTDTREFKAKVLGSDKQSDVAVLKIDAKNLPTVRLGHDTDLKVGQWVVAIGAPFGFDNSVTAGIVSAKQRMLPNDGYVPFIQTDVPINPGNSGGPLFDLNGEVVGINSQIYSGTGGYQGVSFAIPIDAALNVSKQLQAHGKVEHGKLGVTIQQVNQALADTFGLDKPRGALVSSVETGGPAGEAGLHAGDVILAVNGKSIDKSSELPMIIAESEPGSVTHLQVWRDHHERDFDVTLGNMNGSMSASSNSSDGEHGKLGLAVRPLTPDERDQADTKSGLLVEDATGPAAAAGIQAGDIVLDANGKPVKTVSELRHVVEHSGQHVALLVQRGNARIFVPITLG